MKRLLFLGIVAVALMSGGCVAPETAPTAPAPAAASDLQAVQEGWPEFADALAYSMEAARQRALLTQEEFDEMVENERDWQQALIMFGDLGTLRVYRNAGWWDAFIEVTLWNAEDRGDRQARRDAEAYDDLVREVIR